MISKSAMRLASLVTLLILLAGTPGPAFLAYAEDLPQTDTTQAPPADTPVDPPAQTLSQDTNTQDASSTPAEDGADGAPMEDGENGENGDDADTPPVSDGVPTTLETGDASSGVTDASTANITTVDTDTPADEATTTPPIEEENVPDDTASSTDPVPTAQSAAADAGTTASGGSTGPVTLGIDNTLGETNDASSTAASGLNLVADPDGSHILTGRSDAFGFLISLFNVAVTNSTGSILFLRNPLGDALNFTERIMDIFARLDGGGRDGSCSFLGCELTDAAFNLFTGNEVEITNNLVVSSLTGENRAYSSDGSADIETGDASAFGGIVNFGNLQIVDSRYLVLLMTNAGNLAGDILLPDGDFFETLSSGAALGGGSTLDATNTADIANNATTTAETGANGALGENGASILSGDASAKTSVMNFANQIGAPICFVVNVGGHWNGKIVGLPEGFSEEKTPFGEIICGAGGAEARAARDNFHATTTNYAKILNNALVEAKTGGNIAEGADASIKTGDAQAFLSILNVVNQTIIGQDWIFALFTVSGDWNGDLVFGAKPGQPDVLDAITQQLVGPIVGQGAVGGYEPDITFTKHASVHATTTPAKVDYEIVVDNAGGKARQVVVNDTLKGPDGRVIGTQHWNLGQVDSGEKITISYTVAFDGKLKPGYYTNTAVLSGQKNLAIGLEPMTAEDVVEILPPGEVLGAATAAPQCSPLLTEYVRQGGSYTPAQVQLLQSFLNESEGEHLQVNGVYDAATIAAVNRFQEKYASDILAPWGVDKPTGNVYYTTQRKVNALYCEDDSKFKLTTEQILEISKFKAKMSAPGANTQDLLKSHDVGLRAGLPTAKGPLLMPPPAIPAIFAPVSEGEQPAASPVSMMSLPLRLFSDWLFSAVPHVEAAGVR